MISTHTKLDQTTSLDTDARTNTGSDREIEKREAKSRLIELRLAAGCAESAKKLAACNRDYFALACENGHCVQVVPTYRCRIRLCPYCAVERQRRAVLKTGPILKSYARANPNERIVLITLTFENSFQSLQEQDKQFKSAFKRLRRMKNWRDRIAAALCSYEFTLTATGWHYHAHILCFRKSWYDQADLAEDWKMAAKGLGSIADVRAVSNLSHGLLNLLQYCFKPPSIAGWSTEQVSQFQSMSKIKLSECFGTLRGLKMDQADKISDEAPRPSDHLFVGCPCPECGEPLRRIKLSWREVEDYPSGKPRDWFVKGRSGP